MLNADFVNLNEKKVNNEWGTINLLKSISSMEVLVYLFFIILYMDMAIWATSIIYGISSNWLALQLFFFFTEIIDYNFNHHFHGKLIYA